MQVETPYDEQFYEEQAAESRSSADVVVPLVMDLVAPASVIDVGCGVGTWLASFKAAGVGAVLGVDGAYIDRSTLHIDSDEFVARDLNRDIGVSRRFDLAMSVEVAEHLPGARAASFVGMLTRLADVVLFSAAVPGQSGTFHINEQWPTYWISLFAENGFNPIDVIRPAVWTDERVGFWYAQNVFLYANAGGLRAHPSLLAASQQPPPPPASLVHPKLLEERLRHQERYYVDIFSIKKLAQALFRATSWRLRSKLFTRQQTSRADPLGGTPANESS